MSTVGDEEFWELSTSKRGGWEQVRTFDRLDDACRCIMAMEGQGIQKLTLQTVVSATDPDRTGVELIYDGMRDRYRIKNC